MISALSKGQSICSLHTRCDTSETMESGCWGYGEGKDEPHRLVSNWQTQGLLCLEWVVSVSVYLLSLNINYWVFILILIVGSKRAIKSIITLLKASLTGCLFHFYGFFTGIDKYENYAATSLLCNVAHMNWYG